MLAPGARSAPGFDRASVHERLERSWSNSVNMRCYLDGTHSLRREALLVLNDGLSCPEPRLPARSSAADAGCSLIAQTCDLRGF